MKKNYFLIGIISLLALIGAGCSSSSKNNTENETNPQTNIETTLQQEAYLFCTQKGHEIQIRYELALNRNIAYCVFSDKTECESVSFLQGKCPENIPVPVDPISQRFEPFPGDEFPLRLCDLIAQPVCGVDNKTYTNGCIAEFLGVKIAEHKACDRSGQVETNTANTSPIVDVSVLPTRNNTQGTSRGTGSSPSTTNPPRTPNPGTAESANTNAWVEIPLSLLQSTAGNNSRIDRCSQAGVITFYVHDDFPTLYNAKGEVICYPKHDINNTCPSYITSGSYTSSCTPVAK